MLVVIDSRETAENQAIIRDILSYHKIITHVEKLNAGDFFLTSIDTGIERKTVGDLCANFGHVRDQLRRCRETYKNTVLLIEGKWNVDRQSGFVMRWENQQRIVSKLKARDLRRSLASFTMNHGIHILWSTNIYETSDWLVDLCYMNDKPIRRVLGYDSKRPELRVLNCYASIPGIGEELAYRVAERFPVPPIPSDWARKLEGIPGIGPGKIEEAERFLRGDWRKLQSKLPLANEANAESSSQERVKRKDDG